VETDAQLKFIPPQDQRNKLKVGRLRGKQNTFGRKESSSNDKSETQSVRFVFYGSAAIRKRRKEVTKMYSKILFAYKKF